MNDQQPQADPAGRPDPGRIIRQASAYFDSCVLFAAVDAGVFTFLAGSGPATAEAVAAGRGLDGRAVRLLLDACVATGLLAKDGDLYRNTPESAAFLVPGSPGDLSRALAYNRDVYPAWGRLPAFLASGRPVERPELHLGEDAARTQAFVLSMHGRALGIGRAVVPLLDLAGCASLLDVGGGPGTYSVLLARANPGLSCTVLDLPAVVAVADGLIAAQGAADRVTTLAGDYRTTAFPPGQDAVLFFGMLHQETPASIADLLARAFAALRPGGRVFVMDMMTDATRANPPFSALFAVNMALTTESGWVFSDEDLRGWVEDAGFRGFRVRPLPAPMPHWLAEARRP